MHSIEVNIRIIQPEKVMFKRRSRGEHQFRMLTNPDVNLSRMYQLFCHVTIFSCLASVTKVMLTGP